MKIIIVPHTHWDREWYFTTQTSLSLFDSNIDTTINNNYDIKKFYLDGQVSLVEQYLNHANDSNKKKFIKLINDKKLIVGPLYSQPDVFNSLGETTIRNIEIAQKVLKENNLSSTKIFYCPDTFGFGFNFPQIINFCGFNKFIFWRGLPKENADNDYFKWVGIENSYVDAFRFKYGYWVLGAMFPWRKINKKNYKILALKFLDDFTNSDIYKHLSNQASKYNNKIILPFGGDQAPIHPLTNLFFEHINKLSKDEWVISDYDEFFENNKPKAIHTGTIDYGYESKIHRTNSSSRYDFKKLFRDNEISLYHQLEPLELFYKHSNKKYCINNDNIIKNITLMQAHDILGGSVSDEANLSCYQKLLDTKDIIDSKIDLIMKQLAIELNLDHNNLLIFNPNVNNKNKNYVLTKIYTSKPIEGMLENNHIKAIVINCVKSSDVDNTYEIDLFIVNKKIKPFDYLVIDLNKFNDQKYLASNFDDHEKFTNFYVANDNGDLFDSDEDKDNKLQIIKKIKSSIVIDYDGLKVIDIKGELFVNEVTNDFEIIAFEFEHDNYYLKIKYSNNNKDIIVKWTSDLKFSNLKFIQHLGVSNYLHRTIKNWAELNYKENPIDVEKTSGLIFDDNNYICVAGTNEFTYDDKNATITLFRTTGFLGKANLKNRPGVTSGIVGHHISTPLAQLINKELIFEFKLGKTNSNINDVLNSFFKKPIVFHPNSNNLIKSRMEKFVTLKNDIEIKNIDLAFDSGFVSSSRMVNNSICFNAINLDNKNTDFNKLKRITLKLK